MCLILLCQYYYYKFQCHIEQILKNRKKYTELINVIDIDFVVKLSRLKKIKVFFSYSLNIASGNKRSENRRRGCLTINFIIQKPEVFQPQYGSDIVPAVGHCDDRKYSKVIRLVSVNLDDFDF